MEDKFHQIIRTPDSMAFNTSTKTFRASNKEDGFLRTLLDLAISGAIVTVVMTGIYTIDKAVSGNHSHRQQHIFLRNQL